MELYRLTIHELRDLIQKGEVSPVEVVQQFLARISEVEPSVQAFNTVTAEPALATARRLEEMRLRGEKTPPLAGIPIAVKDVICTKGIATTCSSRILENYIPPYDATVMSRLNAAGCVMLGKTNMDEFAMGSSTENSAFKKTRNPRSLDHVPGGSSGGSATAVAADMCAGALGSDTGGSVRQPASFCGVVGVKPTYGRVSRFGLIAYASSLDQIGALTKDVSDAAILLGIISGWDPLDSTSLKMPVPDYLEAQDQPAKLRVGVPAEYLGDGLNDDVRRAADYAIAVLEEEGNLIVDVRLPHTEFAVPAYYVCACAEASSNLGRYDGVKYGYRAPTSEHLIDMYMKTRREGFGSEVKRRIMLGTYALSAGYYDAYYLKALKTRALIAEDFRRAFEVCDVLLHPVAPTPAFEIGEKIDDPLAMYLGDIYSVTANLVGAPAISVPCGTNRKGLPIGIQLTAKPLDELTMFRAAFALERALRERGPGSFALESGKAAQTYYHGRKSRLTATE